MFKRLKHISDWTPLSFCGLFLAALLVACGAAPNSSTATPAPTAPPSPTPTPVPMTPVAGNGYTMSYPQAWQTSHVNEFVTTSKDPKQTSSISSAMVLNSTNAESLMGVTLQTVMGSMTNPQAKPVPPTEPVGGESWSQKSVTGTQKGNNGDTPIQVVVLVTIHPAKAPTSKGYTIVYSLPQATFSQEYNAYIKPCLQSYHFQS